LELSNSVAQLPLLPHAAAAGLTRLALPDLQYQGMSGQPAQLLPMLQEVAKFTNLQHLTLGLPWLRTDAASALSTTLQALQCLTCLQLDGITGTQLQLGQLASLQVLSVGFAFQISPEDSSSIGRLTNLRSLKLDGHGYGACDPAALSGVTALQSATLSKVRWGSTAALQHWLAAQQQLTLLRCSCKESGELSAFASIPRLQQLYFDQHVLSGSLQGMFSQRRQLSHLHTLHLGEYQYSSSPGGAINCLMTVADAVAVAQSCPALKSFLGGTLPAVPQFSNLQHLTCLHVAQVRGEEQTEALESLTGLRQLSLCTDHGSGKKKQNDFRSLGKLSNLSHLSIAPTPGYDSGQISDPSFFAALRAPGLKRLEFIVGLTDSQLKVLTGLMQLIHLQLRTWRLGVLAKDRLPADTVHRHPFTDCYEECVFSNTVGGFCFAPT
jgi:hypothetical protein